MTRREFIGSAAAAAAGGASGDRALPGEIRGVLLHWGHNMWGESLPEGVTKITNGRLCNDHLKFDDALWQKLVDHLLLRKMNLVVIDLGEFPVYPSHPELAVKGSRSPDWVRTEVRRLKKLGLEPIPETPGGCPHAPVAGAIRGRSGRRQGRACCARPRGRRPRRASSQASRASDGSRASRG